MKIPKIVPPMLRAGYKHEGASLKQVGQDAKGFLKKNYNLNEPLFKKSEEGRNVNNLWTGYEYGGKGRAMATIGLLGGGAIVASDPRGYQKDYNESYLHEVSKDMDVESLQSTRADGQGYTPQLSASALQSMSASGDLVFALNRTRHSGQI